MLSGLYHSQTLKPDRSQKPDPKQKRHHPSPVCTGKKSGAVGSNKGEKGKGTGDKLQTENLLLEPREKTVLSCIHSSQVCSAESPAAAAPDSVVKGMGVICRTARTKSYKMSRKKGVLPTCCWGQEHLPTHPKHFQCWKKHVRFFTDNN